MLNVSGGGSVLSGYKKKTKEGSKGFTTLECDQLFMLRVCKGNTTVPTSVIKRHVHRSLSCLKAELKFELFSLFM